MADSIVPKVRWNALSVQERIQHITCLPAYNTCPGYKILIDASGSGVDTRPRKLWMRVRNELKEPRCHCCPYSDGRGACGWAYITCSECDQAFCADYFSRWFVQLHLLRNKSSHMTAGLKPATLMSSSRFMTAPVLYHELAILRLSAVSFSSSMAVSSRVSYVRGLIALAAIA